jgi:hypothetical protein
LISLCRNHSPCAARGYRVSARSLGRVPPTAVSSHYRLRRCTSCDSIRLTCPCCANDRCRASLQPIGSNFPLQARGARAREAKKTQTERKANTQRKVVAGALATEHFEKNRDSEFGRVMFRLLDEYVVRPHDRMLFSFRPHRKKRIANYTLPTRAANFIRAGRETGRGPLRLFRE